MANAKTKSKSQIEIPFVKTLPAKFLFLFVYLLVFGWWGTLFAQALNFTPLERGDYSEEEQKLFVLRGVEITGDFGLGLSRNDFSDLGVAEGQTQYQEDFRLKFRTVFHRELAMHLTLETLPAQLSAGSLRVEDSDNPSHIGDSEPMPLHAREAFLKFKFNPGSSVIFGKQELSLGDRRGKVFSGALPGLTYNCKVGTWCMPFGAALLGKSSGDWLIHWALEYTAWDNKAGAFRDRLQVEIFRVFYNESNVP
ncbi:MAG: hypothetical protein V3S29_12290, partial [bacterium]